MLRQFELVERVRSYDPNVDEEGLDRAYVFAVKMHGSQKRASGDPYFSHPVEVAGILTEYKLDYASIVTALLHDTIEDTAASYEDIKEMFGEEVAKLVEGVTKLSRIQLQSDQTKQAENFWLCRKIFAFCWSSWRIAFTICGLCNFIKSLKNASVSRAKQWKFMRLWPNASVCRK